MILFKLGRMTIVQSGPNKGDVAITVYKSHEDFTGRAGEEMRGVVVIPQPSINPAP